MPGLGQADCSTKDIQQIIHSIIQIVYTIGDINDVQILMFRRPLRALEALKIQFELFNFFQKFLDHDPLNPQE